MDSADQFLSHSDQTVPALKNYIDASKLSVTRESATAHPADCQSLTHGFAWQATLATGFEAITHWIRGLNEDDSCSPLDIAIANVAAAELLQQLLYGTEMSQLEILHSDTDTEHHRQLKSHAGLFAPSRNAGIREFFKSAICNSQCQTNPGLSEELLHTARQFESFSASHICPYAQQWHLDDALIPDSLIQQLGDLGVFGLTIDEQYGGSGFGKLAMCVVTEELSRGYLGVGSLGTRSEIAGELIQLAGSEQQKQKYLSQIANGTLLPTAVFTEPDTGSDLASIQTRARQDKSGDWTITGNKTWITHASRSDLMTLLVRTDTSKSGYDGLTMFLVDKQRGSDAHPFPDDGLHGTPIDVLGYRGMREYDIAFDNFPVQNQAILGNIEGQGFKQLMTTFEAARIQTAARAVGVARSAFDHSLQYSNTRRQFGAPISNYQRIYDKLILMLANIEISRQLTYTAARKKDGGDRCDTEAGMAKLFSARTAWACADAAVQIHGGIGYASSHPVSRLLVDARVLGIFEGTSEIQCEVIAKRLLR